MKPKPHLFVSDGLWMARLPFGVAVPTDELRVLTAWCYRRGGVPFFQVRMPTLVVAQNGLPHVDIITCDSVQEARELVNLACAETVGGCQ